MGAKDVELRVIPGRVANPFVRSHHYSGKVVNNSSLHFGAFLNGRLHGVMSYGPSMDKRKMMGLVEGTTWDGFLELNRMAFDPVLPRNSESRCISVSLRMIRRQAPQVRWVVSFADGCSCGDGAIYRAAGFLLTDIRPNANLLLMPDGSKLHKMTLESSPTRPLPEAGGRSYFDVTGGRYDLRAFADAVGAEVLPGFQLRYIRFLDPSWRDRLNVPVIPYGRIDEMGAGMYRGERVTVASRREACDDGGAAIAH